MRSWKVQDAKARFSEFLDACINDGPQAVTRRGTEQAVLVPVAEWKRLAEASTPSLKDLLTTDFARGMIEVPTRGHGVRRPNPFLED